MIQGYTITKDAAARWIKHHPFMPKAQLRAKWDEYTAKAKKLTPHETDENEHWQSGGYIFAVIGTEIIDVYPFRPHKYRP